MKPNAVKVAPTRSALNVLVNGAVPALSKVVPAELITVFTKLAPALLVLLRMACQQYLVNSSIKICRFKTVSMVMLDFTP